MGRPVFEVFPDDADDASSASHRALRAALGRVRDSGVAETLPTYRYDIRREESEEGGFEERHWRTSVTPVFAGGGGPAPGRRPAFLLLRTEDTTRQTVSDRSLSDARSRTEATLGAAEIGTWVWDLGTNRVFADRSGGDVRPVGGGGRRRATGSLAPATSTRKTCRGW